MPEIFKGYEDGFLPFGPAAGAISGLNEEYIISKILDVANSPANAAKWGSITQERNEGNSGKFYYHNEKTGLTANAIGLQNIGFPAARRLQKKLQPQVEAKGKPLIPSFSPGKGEDPYEVLPQMALGFAEDGVEIMEVNYSCANKPAETGDGYEPVLGKDLDAMFEVEQKILETVGNDITLIRKLYPYFWDRYLQIPVVAGYFNEIARKSYGSIVLALFNSVGNQSITAENGQPALAVGESRQNLGSISGPKLAELSVNGLRRFKEVLDPKIKVLSSLGVNDAKQIYERVNVEGADSTEGVTILWENEMRGIKFGQTISDLTKDYHDIIESNT